MYYKTYVDQLNKKAANTKEDFIKLTNLHQQYYQKLNNFNEIESSSIDQ